MDWKRPAHPGAPARPPRQQAVAAAGSGRPPAWRGQDGDARRSGKARPAPGSRAPRPAGRNFPRADARPRSGPPRTGRREGPGDFPPRPRPGQQPGFGQRPRPGGAPFRGQHRDRPAASPGASGTRGAEPVRPRASRGEQRPGERRPDGRRPDEPGRKPSYRPPGNPAASGARRPPTPSVGRPPASFRPRGEQRRPASGVRPPGDSRERGARPAASYNRPRGQKFPPRSGAKSSPGGGKQEVPFAGRPKPWSRSGNAAGKSRNTGANSGKPPAGLRGPKPDRKKPGA
jgi:hypothetical protein